jgi:hypothetical protein
MTKLTKTALAAVLILSLISAGCTASAIDILNLAVGALEIALPLVAPAAGIDPTTASAVESYLAATSAAISQASDILAGPGTDAQKAAAIAQAFAGIAKPLVPAKYTALVNAVQEVAKYVAQFLASTGSTASASASHPLSQGDKEKAVAIKLRAMAVHRATAK